MSNNLFDNPAIGIPLVALFAAIAVWVNRCPRCKRWFSLRTHTRREEKNGKSRNVITAWSCSGCGAHAKNREDLANSPPEPTPIPADVLVLPAWHPRLLWARYRWKGLIGGMVGLLLASFIAFDLEVLRYPGHWQSYLESYADFILAPLSQPRRIRTHVRVAGGNWKSSQVIECCRERVEEGWLQKMPSDATVVEQATRPWKANLAKEGLVFEPAPTWAKYRRLVWGYDSEVIREGAGSVVLNPEVELPAVGEVSVGAKRLGSMKNEYSVDLQDVDSKEIFRIKWMTLLRMSDRKAEFCEINGRLYPALCQATETWKARVTFYGQSSEPSVDLYVEDFFHFP